MKRLGFLFSPLQRAVLALSMVFIFAALMGPPVVRGDDCLSDPLNAADCMRTPGYRQAITIIFGGLPAVAAIIPNIIGGATRATQPQPGPTEPETEQPQEQPTIHYVVQVNSQHVLVTPEEEASLAIKAWKSVAGAPWTPAPEVRIDLAMRPDMPDLRVSPRTGSGEMVVTLACDEQAVAGMRTLAIVGSAPEAQTSADVQVEVQTSPYQLQISQERFEIAVGETVDLEVAALQLTESGLWEEVPDARIRPWLPTEKDFFDWSPPPPYTRGGNELYGRVVLRITAINARKPEELCYLSFTAIYPDRTEIDKRVEIILKAADYELIFL